MSAMCSRVCRNEGNVMKSKREKYYTDKNRSICLLHGYVPQKKSETLMDQTLFYWTWNGIKHHFLNIKQIRTCSSIGNQTWTTYSSPLTNEHQTDLLIDLSNYPSVETERNFARNSLGSLENFDCQTRSLARSSARSLL